MAIHLMNTLKKKGLSIPGDIMVTGFDGTSQSALVEPALTTVQIPSIEIGRMSADILLARIRNPELPYSWTHPHQSGMAQKYKGIIRRSMDRNPYAEWFPR